MAHAASSRRHDRLRGGWRGIDWWRDWGRVWWWGNRSRTRSKPGGGRTGGAQEGCLARVLLLRGLVNRRQRRLSFCQQRHRCLRRRARAINQLAPEQIPSVCNREIHRTRRELSEERLARIEAGLIDSRAGAAAGALARQREAVQHCVVTGREVDGDLHRDARQRQVLLHR